MNKLVATTLESKFHTFDVRTHHPTQGYPSVAEKVRFYKCTQPAFIYRTLTERATKNGLSHTQPALPKWSVVSSVTMGTVYCGGRDDIQDGFDARDAR